MTLDRSQAYRVVLAGAICFVVGVLLLAISPDVTFLGSRSLATALLVVASVGAFTTAVAHALAIVRRVPAAVLGDAGVCVPDWRFRLRCTGWDEIRSVQLRYHSPVEPFRLTIASRDGLARVRFLSEADGRRLLESLADHGIEVPAMNP